MIRRSFLKACAAVLPTSLLPKRETEAVANRETPPENLIGAVERGDKGRVFDAEGVEVKDCIKANLTTGRCVVYELDSNGNKFVSRDWTPLCGIMEAAKMAVYHPAPMRFEPFT